MRLGIVNRGLKQEVAGVLRSLLNRVSSIFHQHTLIECICGRKDYDGAGLYCGAVLPILMLSGAECLRVNAQAPSSGRQPKIVFILTDDLGYGELGVYGGGILRGAPTPRLDKLASEGLGFTNMNMETSARRAAPA